MSHHPPPQLLLQLQPSQLHFRFILWNFLCSVLHHEPHSSCSCTNSLSNNACTLLASPRTADRQTHHYGCGRTYQPGMRRSGNNNPVISRSSTSSGIHDRYSSGPTRYHLSSNGPIAIRGRPHWPSSPLPCTIHESTSSCNLPFVGLHGVWFLHSTANLTNT